MLKLIILLLFASSSSHAWFFDPDFWPSCENEGECMLSGCPDCSMVDCIPELAASDCPDGSVIMDRVVQAGCCPACVIYNSVGYLGRSNVYKIK